jgi:thioredoxin 1
MIYLNDDNFKSEIAKSTLPCIVDFYADWCGPCKMLGPIFEETSNEYAGKCNFFKVDVDKANAISAEYGVMSIPTLIMFNNGVKIATQTGALPKEMLKNFINKNI